MDERELKLISVLAKYLVKNTEYQYDVIEYGLQAIFSTFLCVGLSIFISVVIGTTDVVLPFLLMFIPMRINTKGYHCKNFSTCIIIFNIVILSNTGIYHFINKFDNHIILTSLLIIIISIMTYNENKNFRFLHFFYILAAFIFELFEISNLHTILVMGVITQIILLLLYKVENTSV